MSKIIFEEEQKFNQPWIIIMLVLAIAVVSYTSYTNYNGDPWETIFGPVLILVASAMLFLIRLKTRIDEEGIHVKFAPFINRWKLFSWNDIYSAEVVKYSPIGDYGGWGYRISFKGKGKAFNTRGDMGIKIQTDEGKIRMIGTQKPEEAKTVIAQFHPKS